jgi:hypothetical protein
LTEIYGIPKFLEVRPLTFELGAGCAARMYCALAYAGAMEIEIICPIDGNVSIYANRLVGPGVPVRHHHCSLVFDCYQKLERYIAQFEQSGKTAIGNRYPGRTDISRFFYVDYTPELGHFMEGAIYDEPTMQWRRMIPRY